MTVALGDISALASHTNNGIFLPVYTGNNVGQQIFKWIMEFVLLHIDTTTLLTIPEHNIVCISVCFRIPAITVIL